MADADIAYVDNRFFISGQLKFSNVLFLYKKSLLLFNKNIKELHFDFSKLTKSDSSGIALMIEWVKFAKEHHRSIRFYHITPDLKAIAKLAGMSDFLLMEDN